MFYVSDLYEELSYGELSSLAMAVEGAGTIQEEKRPSVLLYANAALTLLYTRFVLKQSEVLIEQYEHITNYHLIQRFTESNGSEEEPYLYIKDLAGEPFKANVVKILKVFDIRGNELPINDANRSNSLFTPQDTVLQVPEPKAGQPLNILYQAFHDKLKEDDDEIVLPLTLHNAFRSYVAYKVFSAIGTQEATAKAQEHLGNYEAQCVLATEKDLVNTSVSETNTRFEKRGWK